MRVRQTRRGRAEQDGRVASSQAFLDQDHHAFGSITPTSSNVIVRLQVPPNESLRNITNNFYSEDGQRLGRIRFFHPADTNASHAAEPGPASKSMKGVVELNRKDTAEIVHTLTKRYTGMLKNYNDLTNDDYVLEAYLTALTHAYDPHSDYMGHASTENFNIQMKLSLSGIGARLKEEDGDCKIEDLVPEGPAEKSGQITNEDIITALRRQTRGRWK